MAWGDGNDWSRLIWFVRRQRAEAAQSLAAGQAKDIEGYREEVGYIRALDQVETEMTKISGMTPDAFEGEELGAAHA